VIKLGIGSDGLPCRRGVTVFARHRQSPVRTSSGPLLSGRGLSTAYGPSK
jgi:hypothetical protein